MAAVLAYARSASRSPCVCAGERWVFCLCLCLSSARSAVTSARLDMTLGASAIRLLTRFLRCGTGVQQRRWRRCAGRRHGRRAPGGVLLLLPAAHLTHGAVLAKMFQAHLRSIRAILFRWRALWHAATFCAHARRVLPISCPSCYRLCGGSCCVIYVTVSGLPYVDQLTDRAPEDNTSAGATVLTCCSREYHRGSFVWSVACSFTCCNSIVGVRCGIRHARTLFRCGGFRMERAGSWVFVSR